MGMHLGDPEEELTENIEHIGLHFLEEIQKD